MSKALYSLLCWTVLRFQFLELKSWLTGIAMGEPAGGFACPNSLEIEGLALRGLSVEVEGPGVEVGWPLSCPGQGGLNRRSRRPACLVGYWVGCSRASLNR